MSQRVKVSIIVPVWNVEAYLEQCLESLINQTLKEIEIIIIDDESPDNSAQIIEKYVRNYPEMIKALKKKNGGQGSARNLGINNAQGEFIGFVDSDDKIDLTMYEKLYNAAIKNQADIAVCDIINRYNNHDTILRKKDNINAYDDVSVCDKIYKKELIGNVRFIENKIWYEDLHFNIVLLNKAKKIIYVDEALYIYNIVDDSTMRNENTLKNLDILTIIDEIIKSLKKENIYQKEIIDNTITGHVLINAISRVALHKTKEKKSVQLKLLTYVKDNNINYKNTLYYQNSKRSRKLIAHLNYNKLFKISELLLKAKNIIK